MGGADFNKNKTKLVSILQDIMFLVFKVVRMSTFRVDGDRVKTHA